jgi:hypothetical protein
MEVTGNHDTNIGFQRQQIQMTATYLYSPWRHYNNSDVPSIVPKIKKFCEKILELLLRDTIEQ